MQESEIYPKYEITCKNGAYGIFGKETISGETFSVDCLSKDSDTVLSLVALLNENKVSVHHAKDVIRDIVLKPLFENCGMQK